MGPFFELKTETKISSIEDFCRSLDKLTYIGQFVNKESFKVIPGHVVQYNGKFYSTETAEEDEPRLSGFCSSPTKTGIITTLALFDTEYVPESCIPLETCPVRVNVWNPIVDLDSPYVSFAFANEQLEKAKKIAYQYHDGCFDVDVIVNDTTYLDVDAFLAT